MRDKRDEDCKSMKRCISCSQEPWLDVVGWCWELTYTLSPLLIGQAGLTKAGLQTESSGLNYLPSSQYGKVCRRFC